MSDTKELKDAICNLLLIADVKIEDEIIKEIISYLELLKMVDTLKEDNILAKLMKELNMNAF